MGRQTLSQKGSSLITVIVAAGLTAVIASAMSSLILNQSKNQNAIFQKSEILDIKQTLSAMLLDDTLCACNFSSYTFNSLQLPTTLKLDALYSECDATSKPIQPFVQRDSLAQGSQTQLKVKKIEVQDLRKVSSTSDNSYQAKIVIEFDADSLILARKPIILTQHFQTDPLSPPTQKRIVSCSSAGQRSLSSILKSVKPYEVTRCIRDTGSNTKHEIKSQCPADMQLLSCAGGPGDQHEKHEGFWILPDFNSNTCILTVIKPACVGHESWTHQKSVALCYEK